MPDEEKARLRGVVTARDDLVRALKKAGDVGPDDGCVARWPNAGEIPVWTPPGCLADALIAQGWLRTPASTTGDTEENR